MEEWEHGNYDETSKGKSSEDVAAGKIWREIRTGLSSLPPSDGEATFPFAVVHSAQNVTRVEAALLEGTTAMPKWIRAVSCQAGRSSRRRQFWLVSRLLRGKENGSMLKEIKIVFIL